MTLTSIDCLFMKADVQPVAGHPFPVRRRRLRAERRSSEEREAVVLPYTNW